ncbi:MAG TPA: SDR family oxidoreductase [Pseudonocardiaceae bacterium]
MTGAGRGLGAAIVRRLAAEGHAVAVNDHAAGFAAADALAGELRAAGAPVIALDADATDETAVAGLVARAEHELGGVRTLVVNATGPQPPLTVDELDWPAMLDQLRFFVKSPLVLLRAVLPGMRARRHGRVIQVGSDIVERAPAGMSAYVAAKAAQHGLTRSWARELGPSGITVNLVAPGWIPVERHAGVEAGLLSGYLADVPLARLGIPDDVAGVVAFLASDAAAFITGERITVNGGHTID